MRTFGSDAVQYLLRWTVSSSEMSSYTAMRIKTHFRQHYAVTKRLHSAAGVPVSSTSTAAAARVQPPTSPTTERRGANHASSTHGHFSKILLLPPRTCRKRLPGWRSLTSGTATDDATPATTSEIKPSKVHQNRECNCWKCGTAVCCWAFFCSCGAPQPLQEGRVDYFEMFQIDPSVFVDLKELEKKFKNMQRAFHPDLFVNRSNEEQEISSANSSLANKAYQTLSQPMRRVKYLIFTKAEFESEDDHIQSARTRASERPRHHHTDARTTISELLLFKPTWTLKNSGGPTDESELLDCCHNPMRVLGSSALEEDAAEDGPSASPAFLMEVMETREQLEDCSTIQEAEDVLKQTREAVEGCLVAMDAALKEGGGKDELADAAIRLRYLYRIEDEARSIIHRFEDAQHVNGSTAE